MRVIGIDQSYTGFGYSVDGDSKRVSFPLSKFSSSVERLGFIRTWVKCWIDGIHTHDNPVGLVVMEGYANGAKFGRELAGELGCVVKLAVLDTTGQDPLVVPPTSLKKFVTGKGNAKKNEMLLGVYKRWGVEFSDDNQADAFSLEKFGLAAIDPSLWSELPKYQQEALAAVGRGPLAKG